MKKYKFILIVLTISVMAYGFPQQRVDNLCFKPGRHITQSKGAAGTGKSTKGINLKYPVSNIDFSVNPAMPISGQKNDLYIGPSDTFLIDTNYVQNGSIIIYGKGVLLVDNAKLDLYGYLWIQAEGQAIFRDSAHLSFKQFYTGQYKIMLFNKARFEATDATIDGNGMSFNWVELHDSTTYIARRVHFSDWVFRKVFDHSTLIIEDANMIGDLLVEDSCNVSFKRCRIILPWLEMSQGTVADIQFPPIDTVLHFKFSDSLPGIDGIGYTMTIDTCDDVWWGIESFPGCSLTIRNCTVMGTALRMPGADTIAISGITDYTLYPDFRFPLSDRYHRLMNCYVYSWQPYPLEQTVLYIDSCSFGEMVCKDNSSTYATRCTCDGIWLHLGTQDNAFLSFSDGLVKSFVGVYVRTTMLLINTSVACSSLWAPPPLGPNYAHQHSNLLAVNCSFEFLPEALDTALVMFAAIDSFKDSTADTIVIIKGSTWIDAGPLSTLNFEKYKLYWAYKGDSNWTLIKDSTAQVYDSILATWNTSGLNDGDYTLRLTIWDDAGDSLTALRDITLKKQAISEQKITRTFKLNSYQNGAELRINFSAPIGKQITLDMFDITGRKIKTLFTGQPESPVGITCTPVSGVYFLRLSENGKPVTITRKTVFVK